MTQLSEFVGNHPTLVFAFVAILGALIWTFIAGALGGVRKVTPMDATRLINQEDALVLDVRAENEFKQGHILNALHIPSNYLSDQLNKLEKHRAKPIITACRTGQTSTKASGILRKNGFEKVYNLSGGILAWESANLPLSKS